MIKLKDVVTLGSLLVSLYAIERAFAGQYERASVMVLLSFWVGTAVGCYRTWHSVTSLALGATLAVGIIIVAVFAYHHLVTVAHSGDLNAVRWPWEGGESDSPPGRLDSVKFLVRRDTAAWASVVAASLGGSWLLVWLGAIGVTTLWLILAAYAVSTPRGRHRQFP